MALLRNIFSWYRFVLNLDRTKLCIGKVMLCTSRKAGNAWTKAWTDVGVKCFFSSIYSCSITSIQFCGLNFVTVRFHNGGDSQPSDMRKVQYFDTCGKPARTIVIKYPIANDTMRVK